MFIFLIIHNIVSKLAHHGYNFSFHERQDPGFLVVSPVYPDRAFTIFDVDDADRQTLPVNLSVVTRRDIEFQVFHSYYRKKDRGVWFEWLRPHRDYDYGSFDIEKIQVIASGGEIHATRNLRESDLLFELVPVHGSKFYNIRENENKCLTVANYKNVLRDAYPLMFKICDGTQEQEFAFVSVLKAVCMLGMDNLCSQEEMTDIPEAEDILTRRNLSFSVLT